LYNPQLHKFAANRFSVRAIFGVVRTFMHKFYLNSSNAFDVIVTYILRIVMRKEI